MSTTYGTVKSVTIPSDGDTIDAVDVNVPIAALWDEHDLIADLTALKAILVPTHGLIRYVRGYGHFVFVTSGTYSASTAASPWILTATDGTAGRWVMDLTAEATKTIYNSLAFADAKARVCDAIAPNYDFTAVATWRPVSSDSNAGDVATTFYLYDNNGLSLKFNTVEATNTARHVIIQLNEYLSDGSTLNSVQAIVKPGIAHVALPATMPAMTIVRCDHVAGTVASLTSTGLRPDTSATFGAYNLVHGWTATMDQNNTVDLSSYVYYLIIHNEGGANSAAELQLYKAVLTMTAKGFF